VTPEGQLAIKHCAVAAEILAELPELGLVTCRAAGAKKSSPGVIEELEALAGRTTGPTALHAHAEPVAAAYRALRVSLGMDPNAGEVSVEAIIRNRLLAGGLRTAGQPADAITITTLETGVPIQVLAVAVDPLELAISPRSGAISLRRGNEDLAEVFGETHAQALPAKGDVTVELAAIVAPGVLPEVVCLALERAASLASS